MIKRKEIAQLIFSKLTKNKESLRVQFLAEHHKIPYFFIDDVLPTELAKNIHKCFPKLEDATCKKNIREYKHIAYQMDQYHPLLEEVIYAFQEPEIVQLIEEICHINNMHSDAYLYAGGLSLMAKNNFLRPHLDNSHDKERERWRVLNLLYYVTPNWQLKNGGNLELWQHGLENNPDVVVSKFNRLVVMATHEASWHSVNKVTIDSIRCCVSNYYFSDSPYLASDKFHVTLFKEKSSKKITNTVLQIDNYIRSFVRKIFSKGIRKNPHQYKK